MSANVGWKVSDINIYNVHSTSIKTGWIKIADIIEIDQLDDALEGKKKNVQILSCQNRRPSNADFVEYYVKHKTKK